MSQVGVSIEEAAHRLGVSANTVRRRIKRGEVAYQRVATPQGYIYRVLLPEAPSPGPRGREAAPPQDGLLSELVNTLRQQLAEKDRQISQLHRQAEELHVLLREAQETARRLLPPAQEVRPARPWWLRLLGRR